jgi:type II secretory pathway pseudopilin PulG
MSKKFVGISVMIILLLMVAFGIVMSMKKTTNKNLAKTKTTQQISTGTDDYSYDSNKFKLKQMVTDKSYLNSYELLDQLDCESQVDELFNITQNRDYRYLPKKYTNADLEKVIDQIYKIQGEIDKILNDKDLNIDYVLQYPYSTPSPQKLIND